MHEQYARHDSPAPTSPRLPTQLLPGGTPAREFAQTDLGNAERLLDQHGKDVRYCAAWKQWLCWDGRRWRLDETNQVMERAKRTVRGMYASAAQIEHKGERAELVEWAQSSESAGRLKAMVELAKSVAPIQVAPGELDRD